MYEILLLEKVTINGQHSQHFLGTYNIAEFNFERYIKLQLNRNKSSKSLLNDAFPIVYIVPSTLLERISCTSSRLSLSLSLYINEVLVFSINELESCQNEGAYSYAHTIQPSYFKSIGYSLQKFGVVEI